MRPPHGEAGTQRTEARADACVVVVSDAFFLPVALHMFGPRPPLWALWSLGRFQEKGRTPQRVTF